MFDRTCCDDGSKVRVWFPVRSTFTLQRDSCRGGSVNLISLRSVWECPVFSTMVELAFYPAVALMYFFGVLGATQGDRVELDDRASMNVFCLFVLVQPLCLVMGGYTGMATYLLTALVSYNFLPWRKTKQAAKGKELKKTK